MPDDPIKTAYEKARNRWPGLSVEIDRLRNRVKSAEKEPEKMAVEDLYLSLAIEDRNPKAMEIFYREYSAYIRNLSLRKVKNPDMAEDIMQEYISELPERIIKFKGSGTLYGWLAFAIPNYAIDYLRKIKYYDEISPETPAPSSAADADIQPDIENCKGFFHQLFTESMKGLKSDWQLMIHCSFFDRLTNREIAQTVLKTPEYNISKWMKRALTKLKKGMEISAKAFGNHGRETLAHCFEVLKEFPDYFDLSGIFGKI